MLSTGAGAARKWRHQRVDSPRLAGGGIAHDAPTTQFQSRNRRGTQRFVGHQLTEGHAGRCSSGGGEHKATAAAVPRRGPVAGDVTDLIGRDTANLHLQSRSSGWAVTLDANGGTATSETPVLTFAKSSLARVAIPPGQAHTQKNFLANSAGNPCAVIQNPFLVIAVAVESICVYCLHAHAFSLNRSPPPAMIGEQRTAVCSPFHPPRAPTYSCV